MATTTMRARFPLLLLLLGILFLASVCATYGASANGGKHKCLKSCAKVNGAKRHHHACHARCKLIQNQASWPKQGEEEGDEEEEEEERSSRNNPFYFPSRKFRTRYGNQHGRIRVLPRFDRSSDKLENLQDYRLVIIEARPNTLVLPKHADAESLLVVQEGEAIVHLANPSQRDSYNLQRGYALRIPPGTISYIVNPNDNQNLRIAKLVIPVNQPGEFDDFFPASNEDQQSYIEGFSQKTLEAAFNTRFEEIQGVLIEDNEEEGQHQQQQQQQQHQEESDEEEGVIVKLSKEQIQELTRDAKSSSRWGGSSESGPFNLRGRPIYSNQFGRYFEATPERIPQLEDLDISLSCVEIKEGALLLPHFNSKAIVVLVANKGKGKLELVALRDEKQKQRGQQEEEGEEDEDEKDEEEEEEGTRQVRRYTVRLSSGDVVVIPAAYPVAINASSDLHLTGFGINAEKNERNFLAGESDNVLEHIHRQVKGLAFPGSGEQVERLLRNQRESYFASAQPQQQRQEKEGRRGRRGPLTSILGAFTE